MALFCYLQHSDVHFIHARISKELQVNKPELKLNGQ